VGKAQMSDEIIYYSLVAGLIVAWATVWFTKIYSPESATTEKTTIEKVVVPK
jgi:hypothetical protein